MAYKVGYQACCKPAMDHMWHITKITTLYWYTGSISHESGSPIVSTRALIVLSHNDFWIILEFMCTKMSCMVPRTNQLIATWYLCCTNQTPYSILLIRTTSALKKCIRGGGLLPLVTVLRFYELSTPYARILFDWVTVPFWHICANEGRGSVGTVLAGVYIFSCVAPRKSIHVALWVQRI